MVRFVFSSYYPDEENGELGEDMVLETECEGLSRVLLDKEGDANECDTVSLHSYIPRSQTRSHSRAA